MQEHGCLVPAALAIVLVLPGGVAAGEIQAARQMDILHCAAHR